MISSPRSILFTTIALLFCVLAGSVAAHEGFMRPPRDWAHRRQHYEAEFGRLQGAIQTIKKERQQLAARAGNDQAPPLMLHSLDTHHNNNNNHHHHKEEEEQDKKKEKMTCSQCYEITNTILGMLENKAGTDVIIEIGDQFCDKELNTTKDKELNKMCHDVVSILVDLVSKAVIELDLKLHWTVNASICADLLNLCSYPCCSTKTPEKPEQIRLTFASPNLTASIVDMRVVWATLAENVESTVMWKVGTEVFTANGEKLTYDYGGFKGWIRGAIMTNLPANTTIHYRVGSNSSWSEWLFFNTLPTNAGLTRDRPLRVIALADMGIFNSSDTISRMTAACQKGEVDFINHYGDEGYADGLQPTWGEWFNMMEPVYTRCPIMYGVGNHELINFFGPYRHHVAPWQIQSPDAPAGSFYYSFKAGPVNFVMLDSETAINTADISLTQQTWAKKQLERANSEPGTFTLASSHRPLYCSSHSFSDCTMFSDLLRSQVEDMFHEYGVDLHQSGHLHSYDRTLPIYNGAPSTSRNSSQHAYIFPDATTYVINGAGGNREGFSGFKNPKPDWSVTRLDEWGYQILTFVQEPIFDAKPHTTMRSSFFRSSDNKITDEFTITSKR